MRIASSNSPSKYGVVKRLAVTSSLSALGVPWTKKNGVAVIFVGEDLDVLLALCDRIMVINSGEITGMVDARTATKEQIGLMMTKTNTPAKEAAQ